MDKTLSFSDSGLKITYLSLVESLNGRRWQKELMSLALGQTHSMRLINSRHLSFPFSTSFPPSFVPSSSSSFHYCLHVIPPLPLPSFHSFPSFFPPLPFLSLLLFPPLISPCLLFLLIFHPTMPANSFLSFLFADLSTFPSIMASQRPSRSTSHYFHVL